MKSWRKIYDMPPGAVKCPWVQIGGAIDWYQKSLRAICRFIEILLFMHFENVLLWKVKGKDITCAFELNLCLKFIMRLSVVHIRKLPLWLNGMQVYVLDMNLLLPRLHFVFHVRGTVEGCQTESGDCFILKRAIKVLFIFFKTHERVHFKPWQSEGCCFMLL